MQHSVRQVVFGRGSVHHASRLIEMHQRCSAETIQRRYNVAMPSLSPRLARRLVQPGRGWSVLAMYEETLVGVATLNAHDTGVAGLGILVEDAWQHRGVGSKLLRTAARHAEDRGLTSITCATGSSPDDVGALVGRAGLQAQIVRTGDSVRVTVPIGGLATSTARRENKLFVGDVTAPLVSLLHRRTELREVSGPADLIDQAVRAGA